MHESSSLVNKHREGRGITASASIIDGKLEIVSHSPPREGTKYEMSGQWFKIDIEIGMRDPPKAPPGAQNRGPVHQCISVGIIRHCPQMQGVADRDGGVGLGPENRSVIRGRNHWHRHIIGSTTTSEGKRGQEKHKTSLHSVHCVQWPFRRQRRSTILRLIVSFPARSWYTYTPETTGSPAVSRPFHRYVLVPAGENPSANHATTRPLIS